MSVARSHNPLLVVFLAPLLALQMTPPLRHLTPGDLDTSFGQGGTVTTDFAGHLELARAVAIQADGKIIVGGRAGVGHQRDFALVRYNADGRLDTSFGVRGKVRTDLGDRDSVAALAIQTDGKIVAAGTITRHGADVGVARYDTNGSLDPTFGTGGMVRLDVSGSFDTANAMAIQPDGKIIVAGYAVEHHVGFALVRFNVDGTLDMTFGSGGETFTGFSGGPSEFQAMGLLPNGKIVAAGFSAPPYTFGGAFALARYNPNGTLDASFGHGGKVTAGFKRSGTFAYGLTLQADGKAVVAGGVSFGSDTDFALARFDYNGKLDEAFGGDGLVRTDIAGRKDIAFSTVWQPDGNIVVVGRSGEGITPDFAITRYNANGTLDTSFGMGGKVTTDFAGRFDAAYACALQTDGRIVIVGGSGLKPLTTFAVARYDSE
jgi:uncharacterized delta-60 repeat protein